MFSLRWKGSDNRQGKLTPTITAKKYPLARYIVLHYQELKSGNEEFYISLNRTLFISQILCLCAGHLTSLDTSLIRTLHFIKIPHLSRHPTNQDTSLIRTLHFIRIPHLSGHPINHDTSLIKTPHYSGHLTYQDT